MLQTLFDNLKIVDSYGKNTKEYFGLYRDLIIEYIQMNN